jgi:CRP-like cAMP-binding protein
MIGNNLLLGVDSIPIETIAQIPGDALTMPATVFREEVRRDGPLRSVVSCYTMALMHQITQSVGCNARHTIVQRCARWLLMTHDRVSRDGFPLTHELLALMLGVRRPGVTVAAGELQRAGLIDYHRGFVSITDRAGLETVACECYFSVREEFERIMCG